MTVISSIAELEALYQPAPAPASLVKVSPTVTQEYARLIEASPFVALATSGPEGLDCSPRGDKPGFIRIHDSSTLMMPDRRGNNRIDSLRNIVRDPRCALLFLIPGSGTTLRVNGRAHLSADPALLESFAIEEKAPRTVVVLQIEEIYFQCARAIMRSELWNPDHHVDPKDLPSAGQMLAAITANAVGGESYDKSWPQRAKETLW
ncbi:MULTISPECIES: pyridoxamine 5'-phosphate oxidase family protein [unclassified Devosia]|uniref:pyridoxamine 5'-phosphate oxidase family protein n=1 Tax=unclassified Devosia TaxID=196773 RepID=UPI00145D09B5|nr:MULTISPECIES: pyridoxamine 5'-phosphate oxidase family protein [unclassified Devosia]MBJ6988884.1 pyridoxamine 5'-phosphate oxidase family protein [Devosia sp. MC521]QMW62234.1 pyridoxamine 5'-phosphate oxidase family protein [Devosia sp. MC521]